MDFGLSRKTNTKMVRKESLLNETAEILSGPNLPTKNPCFSSPNSTNIGEVNFNGMASFNMHNELSNNNQNSKSKQQESFNQFKVPNAANNLDHSSNRISTFDEIIEAKIKANEDYLNHLKSIDLRKFSFPNE
jgi:hypothetical protein